MPGPGRGGLHRPRPGPGVRGAVGSVDPVQARSRRMRGRRMPLRSRSSRRGCPTATCRTWPAARLRAPCAGSPAGVLDRLAEQGGLADLVAPAARPPPTTPRATSSTRSTRAASSRRSDRGGDRRFADRPALERLYAIGLGHDGRRRSRAQYPRVEGGTDPWSCSGRRRPRAAASRPDHEEELERIIGWLDTGFVEAADGLYIEGLGARAIRAHQSPLACSCGTTSRSAIKFDFDQAASASRTCRPDDGSSPGRWRPSCPGRGGDPAGATARGRHHTRDLPAEGGQSERVPEELRLVLQRALAHPQRRILIVLDDLELLRARGGPIRRLFRLARRARRGHARPDRGRRRRAGRALRAVPPASASGSSCPASTTPARTANSSGSGSIRPRAMPCGRSRRATP